MSTWTDQIKANQAAIQAILSNAIKISQLPSLTLVLEQNAVTAFELTNGEVVKVKFEELTSALEPNIVLGTTSQYFRGDKSWQTLNDSHTHTIYQLLTQKNAANGYVGLDANIKINPLHLPALAITDTFVVGSQAAMLLLSNAETGDIAVRTDENKSYILRGTTYSTLADWQEILTPLDAVFSIFGRSGTVTAQANDYTWAQIDKTVSSLANLTTRSYTDLQNIPNTFEPSAHTHIISNITGLQGALDGKVDDAQVLTNVPLNALFTDTIYILPFADNSTNWNTAFSWGNHSLAGYITSYVNTTYTAGSGLSLTGTVFANTAPNINHPLVETAVPVGAVFTDTIYTHPIKVWADKTTLATNVVISNLTINALGHPTDWTTRVLTLADLGYTGATNANNYVLPFTDNSTNWNTAFGWGNHSGLYSLLNHNHAGVYQPVGTYDNYVSWNLKTNGIQRTGMASGSSLDIVGDSGIAASYGAGGVVTLTNTDKGSSVTATTLGLVIGTDVLAQRTFGTAANSAVGDFAPFSHTHAYLPLAGGSMANTNKVTNLNADLLDGLDSTAFALASHTQPLNTITGLEDALALKAPKASPTFTGVVTLPTGTQGKIPKYTSAGVLGDSVIQESADGKVSINGAARIRFTSSGAQNIIFGDVPISANGDRGRLWYDGLNTNVRFDTESTGQDMVFGSYNAGANTSFLKIKGASGNVSIGNTNNIHKLDVTGNIKLSGIHILGQYTTATRPAYVKGAQFFDTTINKMVIGGASTWNTVAEQSEVDLKAPKASPTFTGVVTAPTIKLTTGATAGYYLKSDADGLGSWSPLSASTVYKGTWNASTNTPTLADGTGTAGWWYRVVVAGTFNSIAYSVGDDISYNGTTWERIPGVGYTLETATASVLGGVKIGTGVTISAGVISVSTNYEPPIVGGTTAQYWRGDKTWATFPTAQAISFITGLQGALDNKVDDAQVLTNVPLNALFTDTIYTLPFTNNSVNWNTAFSWGNHTGLYSLLAHNHSGVYQPVGTYDNYLSWNLKTNGVQRTGMASGSSLDIVAGTNMTVSYGAGGVITLAATDTTYTAGSGLNLSGTVFTNTAPNIVQSTITGNAGSATVLQNPRTIWGQSFDGSANIIGALSGATTGVFSSTVEVGNKLLISGADFDFASIESTLGHVIATVDTQDGIFYYGNSILTLNTTGSTFSGEVTATSFFEGSLRKLKKNILPFKQSGLDIINSLDIVTYDMKKGDITDKIGIIIDESPKEVANKEQDAVDLYKTIFVQAKAIQELSEMIDKLNERLIKVGL